MKYDDGKIVLKGQFKQYLKNFVDSLVGHVSLSDQQWTIKGFIDIYKNIYTISSDTKIVSKILEIHLFPKILEFAQKHSFNIVLADHQNYYPDISFVFKNDERVKFALDIKTSYRLDHNQEFCNGFTLGSHGEYFIERTSRKNIQFPYNEYLGHFCLGIIYSRVSPDNIDETKMCQLDKLTSIVSVIKNFQFFICEKWEIASDSSGSGNTANIGSIVKISDILNGNGVFKNLGEEWFDDYWMNYGKITIPKKVKGKRGKEKIMTKKITKLKDFLIYKKKDVKFANPCIRPSKKEK